MIFFFLLVWVELCLKEEEEEEEEEENQPFRRCSLKREKKIFQPMSL
jgi:hypothetical protein